VQVSRPLSYNSQLKVTTAKYYTPTGRCIQVLDYSHRRDDGSVGSVPDSVKKEFKTTHGRTVYDGGGIDPDITANDMEMHPLTQSLYEQGFIMDYVTEYCFKHNETDIDSKTFSLTDAEYADFVNWMKGKKYNYESYLEHQLLSFEKEAKKERYYADLKGQLEQIKTRIAESKKNELMLYKDQIKMLLEEDIVARQYLEKGTVENGFRHDDGVLKAIAVLHNQSEYKKTLNLQ
jgi:carboxyl-terminal processing protease